MRGILLMNWPLGAMACALFLSGCKGASGFSPSPELPFSGQQPGQASIRVAHHQSKIRHIVIVIQENRSLNNLFYGFPGAKTVKYGYDTHKQKIELKPVGLATTWDVEHNVDGVLSGV